MLIAIAISIIFSKIQCSSRKLSRVVLKKNASKLTGKYLNWSLFVLIKLEAKVLELYLNETPTQLFPVDIAKFLITTFSQMTSG